ncbi:MAG: dihydrofolate reductase [Planctomycetales bacterium]|nr:dihydrofolate reductase [Planctomycetales bacterium]
MKVSILAALSANGVIGRGGDLPWRLSSDLKRFKQRTWGHWIVMGRKTFDSIGRALPGRTTVVITRQADYDAPHGVRVAESLAGALALAAAQQQDEVFIVGGGEIYRQAISLADRMYLTRVDAEIDGDVFFPEFDEQAWIAVEREPHSSDDKNEFPYEFQTLDRTEVSAKYP